MQYAMLLLFRPIYLFISYYLFLRIFINNLYIPATVSKFHAAAIQYRSESLCNSLCSVVLEVNICMFTIVISLVLSFFSVFLFTFVDTCISSVLSKSIYHVYLFRFCLFLAQLQIQSSSSGSYKLG